jgi:hypothetical protein
MLHPDGYYILGDLDMPISEELSKKFLPDVLERESMPDWFIVTADSRSKGSVEYIVWDHLDKNTIHADYFLNGVYHETKTFEVQPTSRNKRSK